MRTPCDVHIPHTNFCIWYIHWYMLNQVFPWLLLNIWVYEYVKCQKVRKDAVHNHSCNLSKLDHPSPPHTLTIHHYINHPHHPITSPLPSTLHHPTSSHHTTSHHLSLPCHLLQPLTTIPPNHLSQPTIPQLSSTQIPPAFSTNHLPHLPHLFSY